MRSASAAAIQALTGIVVAGDDLKKAVYGVSYQGGTAEVQFRGLLRTKYGLGLAYLPERSASQGIIDAIRTGLAAGSPVLVTMHSRWSTPWVDDTGDGLHCGVAFQIDKTDAGMLHIMNPWGGFDHVKPVSWWRDRLGDSVSPISKLGAAPSVVLPPSWRDDGKTLVCANGQPVVGGFRDYVLEKLRLKLWGGGDAYGPEWTGPDGRVRQLFADAMLVTDLVSPVREGTVADVCALAAHEREGKAA